MDSDVNLRYFEKEKACLWILLDFDLGRVIWSECKRFSGDLINFNSITQVIVHILEYRRHRFQGLPFGY